VLAIGDINKIIVTN
jgi:hypothetical protein